jgi:adenine deaminase
VMNFPGVINGDEKIQQEIAATRMAGKVVGGHFPSLDLSLPFHAYVAGGAEDDHEGTRIEDAVSRARQGMRVMMRFGSAWHDVAVLVKAVTELGLDPRHFILCTDDAHSQTLHDEGHMDRVLRHAISQGLSPMLAIQMATINTAEHFGVSKELGMIAPGRYADILLVKDLTALNMDLVIAKGQILACGGVLQIDLPKLKRPQWVVNSICLKRPLQPSDFCLSSSADNKPIFAHVIGIIENQASTRHLRVEMRAEGGEVKADINNDIAKIAMIERHHATGGIKVGLVQGFGFDIACAVASTVAHDCHHLVVVGTDDLNMAIAVNTLAEFGGGQVVVKQGKVVGKVELPIAGLMSDEPVEVVATKAASVLSGFRACGCKLNNPNMQLSLLGLVVIPQLRISDLGLVDVDRFRFISVIENEVEK